MNNNIFGDCEWLSFDERDAHLTRTCFETDSVRNAELFITGLGYFEAYMNGASVTDAKLIPAKSNYSPRDLSKAGYPIHDEMTSRIYYHRFDVTSLVTAGRNVLACHIGAGWHGAWRTGSEGMPKWGNNTLIFRLVLTLENGEKKEILSSPANTVWFESPVEQTDIYLGETHNYSHFDWCWKNTDFNDEKWHACSVVSFPDSELTEADYIPDAVAGELEAKLVSSFGDRKIYDIGEHSAGWAVINFYSHSRNQRAEVRYADELNEDGSLDFSHCGDMHRIQWDTFINGSDRPDEIHPLFTWHAGRYVELTGPAEVRCFQKVYTPLEQTVFFESDNETLNWIFDAYVRTQLQNTHGCIPSDCPHRERLGYTGDGQLACGAVMSVFDARKMYKKWMLDIRDCQDVYNGHVQHTTPFYGGGGGPGGWGGAAVIVPYRYYRFYNDRDELAKAYSSMKAYIGYMRTRRENGLVVREEEGGWCLGDWCTPGKEIKIPPEFVNTYYLAKCSRMCAETAEILGKNEDIPYYEETFTESVEALVNKYFDEKTGSFFGGVQGADAFAADLGIGDDRTLKNIVEKYSALKTYDTGIFGTFILTGVLFEKGYSGLAVSLLANEGEASYYNMKTAGATTIWEYWEGRHSRCHPMFGAIVEYFVSYILGVKRSYSPEGEEIIEVRPSPADKPCKVRGSVLTRKGRLNITAVTDEKGEVKADFFYD